MSIKKKKDSLHTRVHFQFQSLNESQVWLILHSPLPLGVSVQMALDSNQCGKEKVLEGGTQLLSKKTCVPQGVQRMELYQDKRSHLDENPSRDFGITPSPLHSEREDAFCNLQYELPRITELNHSIKKLRVDQKRKSKPKLHFQKTELQLIIEIQAPLEDISKY